MTFSLQCALQLSRKVVTGRKLEPRHQAVTKADPGDGLGPRSHGGQADCKTGQNKNTY